MDKINGDALIHHLSINSSCIPKRETITLLWAQPWPQRSSQSKRLFSLKSNALFGNPLCVANSCCSCVFVVLVLHPAVMASWSTVELLLVVSAALLNGGE